jgi:hypothetical protein
MFVQMQKQNPLRSNSAMFPGSTAKKSLLIRKYLNY